MRWTFFDELRRKIIHLVIILIIVLYVVLEKNFSRQISLFTLVFILLFLLMTEYVRLELNIELPVVGPILRAKEEKRMHGAIYFLSATIISLAVFDFRIALTALLMTVFGDMFAAIVGQRFGRTLIFKNKTLSGCLAELVVNLIVGLIVLSNIYMIIIMAFTATIVESFVDELDDNLFIPLFAGSLGQLLFFLI
ncbi:CTP--2,3-di-O-geranylgeranyl-sn-glycero-1-phosphate cytidyltransferase [Candidatus Woesearchaeota archaeon]|nr:CTP--2,3-di-O-geranylgeranyl-sn-glycero-1-phosphate cytidyltransferase [Candidatus Woesearchaeota archaeon]